MQGKIYRLSFRRRREGKTNYRSRLALLKSRKNRVVVRKTCHNIRGQVIQYTPQGDKILVNAISSELKKYGWDSHGTNAPASYLTGFLLGKRAKAKGIKEGVLDIGLHAPSKGANIFCTLNGMLDAGIKIPHGKDILPSEDRIKGVHIDKKLSKKVDRVKEKIEADHD